jgi:membrane-associated phospholipid phosphatase
MARVHPSECCESHARGRVGNPVSRAETVGLIAVAGFGALACAMPILTPIDAWTAALAHGLRNRAAFSLVKWLTRGAPYVAAILVLLGVGIAHWRGVRRRSMLRVLAQFAIGLLLLEGFKLSCIRFRPGGLAVHPVPDSFPSGHVANAALSVVAAIELVRRAVPAPRLMRILSAHGVVFVAAVAGTRLYFGLHWLTDIVASLLLGVAFAAFVAAYRAATPWRARITVVVVLSLLYLTPASGIRVLLASPGRASGVIQSLSSVTGSLDREATTTGRPMIDGIPPPSGRGAVAGRAAPRRSGPAG